MFGIRICLDSSLILIFALIVYLLGANVFPGWHPEWPGVTTWTTAAIAGVMFCVSVLAHELAHSLVSLGFGVQVKRITLFLFGGLAEIEEEPPTPRAEFLIAIAGPLTSLFIGVVCIQVATASAGVELVELLAQGQEEALAELSPLATLCLWLGPFNIVLGLFNMVPGFPLDGGRVLRALLWWLSGDQRQATRIASASGRIFGWMLMLLGVMQAVSGAVMQGLWLVLIGWFLSHAASSSYSQIVIRDLLRGVTARQLMRTHFETVSPQTRVSAFIDDYLLQSAQLLWPVVEGEQLVGLLTLEEVRKVPEDDRSVVTVGQVMHTQLGRYTLAPDSDAQKTLAALSQHDSPMAVVEGGRVLGLLSQVDVVKWIRLHDL